MMKASIIIVIIVGIYVVAQPREYGVELLIYDKDHWMDELSTQELNKRISNGRIKLDDYNNRDRRGDIIEIHEYPYWSQMDPKNWGGHAFRVVVVKGITVEQAKSLGWGQRKKVGELAIGRRMSKYELPKVDEIEIKNRVQDVIIGSN